MDPAKNITGKLFDRDGNDKARDLVSLQMHFTLRRLARFGQSHNYSVEKPPEQLEEVMARRCREKKIPCTGLRPFQSSIGRCTGHLLAVAPTGSGNTEGSLDMSLHCSVTE